MDMLDRYLNAVAAQLPQEQREDIIAELKDLILSRFEAKEEELGRDLTDAEKEAILREVGHPLIVAARYRKGPDSLVGPELFPFWMFAVKLALIILAVVSLVALFFKIVDGSANFGQDIAQAFHGFFSGGLTVIGFATLTAAIFEHYNIRPKWLTDWKARDLDLFVMADAGKWGLPDLKPAPASTSAPKRRAFPGGEYLGSAIFSGLFVLWWTGVLRIPGMGTVGLAGEDAVITGAPIWSTLFIPILVYALISIVVDLISLARPYEMRLRSALQMMVCVIGLWLTWTIWNAGHWFTLTRGDASVQITGGAPLLNFEALGGIDNMGVDLTAAAAGLSVIGTWVLACAAFGLGLKFLKYAWQAATGRRMPT